MMKALIDQISEEQINSIVKKLKAETIKCVCRYGLSGKVTGGIKTRVEDQFKPLKYHKCKVCDGKCYIEPQRSRNISLIVAMGENNAIGKDNGLLWNIPQDLKYFRKQTLNKTIMMGRKTFESIGKVLPKRKNIIVSRKNDYVVDGAEVISDPGRYIVEMDPKEELVVIGGGELYNLTLPWASKLYITRVKDSPEADTHFPKLEYGWVEESVDHNQGEIDFDFCVLRRKK